MHNGIPLSVSLDPVLEAENIQPKIFQNKKRITIVSGLAVLIAICISFIAKFLVYLIDLITNISFHGNFSIAHGNPANNSLGLWVVIITPNGGGWPDGTLWLKGHTRPRYSRSDGTDTNQPSKIKSTITYLKPIDLFISIFTW